ncbi:hypothetical protein BS47DRAFT_369718 [Hydnum rufescens UP504]|uniref:Rho-GAP domain-containing protein n=1 Tax=Hydnum rufescens UP504 TaxID=1448309 RepID=A0A9P6DLF9_9AGAM|nr:hypothetical protein BS47DRAFT_369718 [Hydnum rufescens UP504]
MNKRDGSLTPPPTKASLRAWWKNFTSTQKFKRDPTNNEKEPAISHVFGVPLRESLRYANVQISTATGGDRGDLYIYGYVPVVVAKCGLHLKEVATEVEGTFRVSGSNKRMRDLQTVFETPPRYGKNLDWKKENYTTHDIASVFRRYLTQMPEPVIPHNLYHHFRNAYAQKPFVQEGVINTFKILIRSMPRANQYLLLYVLDLLSVFSRKSDKNLMTAANLAVIFRPGIISHPDQELSPEQHKLSQEVLEFLIEQQDMFILDIPPPPRNDSILIPASPATDPDPDLEVYLTPSESDEEAPKGGWRLVERGKVRPTPLRSSGILNFRRPASSSKP